MAYKPLDLTRLNRRVSYSRPTQVYDSHVSLDSAAYLVMTDLSKVSAVTIGPMASIDDANDRMIANAVRMLLVTNEQELTLGLITATDILGEKPLNYLREVGGNHGDILVQDIMTPYDQLEAMELSDVLNASVGDIVATLKQVGRQHALVVDSKEGMATPRIRGIFSTSQIGMLVGEQVDLSSKAGNFAELELALVHG
ncbi:MAG: CBS domain-containing protein [Gammaproteobacteria bacterium]|nr:CBS domain-containing protein [Gammaproteobacteria bacterium]